MTLVDTSLKTSEINSIELHIIGCFYNPVFARWRKRSISKLRKFDKNIHNQIAYVNMNMVQKLNFVTDP